MKIQWILVFELAGTGLFQYRPCSSIGPVPVPALFQYRPVPVPACSSTGHLLTTDSALNMAHETKVICLEKIPAL